MPKIKYCALAKKRDPLKGLILEYIKNNNLSTGQVAIKMGISRATCSKRLNQEHTDIWLGEAKELCRKMNIPIEEFRSAVRY